MIDRAQVVRLVLEAVPSFSQPYEEWFEREGTDLIGSDVIEGKDVQQKADLLSRASKGDSSGVPIYLMPLPTHLMKLHEQGNWRELTAASDLIERCIVEGDEYVSNWAAIGLLEGIQNTWTAYGSDKFIPFLRPESLKTWNELNDFWQQRGKFKSKWIEKAEILSMLIQNVPSFAEPFKEWAEGSTILVKGPALKEGADLQAAGQSHSFADIDYYKIPVATILLKLHREGKLDEVRAAARLIEQFVVRGDAYVSKWAVASVLAGIKTEWRQYGTEKFRALLLPKSLHYWGG